MQGTADIFYMESHLMSKGWLSTSTSLIFTSTSTSTSSSTSTSTSTCTSTSSSLYLFSNASCVFHLNYFFQHYNLLASHWLHLFTQPSMELYNGDLANLNWCWPVSTLITILSYLLPLISYATVFIANSR